MSKKSIRARGKTDSQNRRTIRSGGETFRFDLEGQGNDRVVSSLKRYTPKWIRFRTKQLKSKGWKVRTRKLKNAQNQVLIFKRRK